MIKIKVGVLFGGKSTENEVSVISGLQSAAALDKEKYEPILIYVSKQGIWYCGEALSSLEEYKNVPALLTKCERVVLEQNDGAGILHFPDSGSLLRKPKTQNIDIFFPVFHGAFGEDGCVQGLLSLSGIPYVGSGVLGSSLGMDKIAMKAAIKAEGLPLVPYQWFYDSDWESKPEQIIELLEQSLGYPMIVKPADLGSSIGISKARNTAELKEAIELACTFAERIVVEKMVEPLREINCSVLGNAHRMRCSVCEEPARADEILSFGDKYLQADSAKGMSGLKRRIPADISAEATLAAQKMAAAVFRTLNCSGVARIDFLLSEDGELFINEINTIPGSLSFYLWEPTGLSFSVLCDELIELALEAQRRKERKTYTFTSDILAQKGFKGKK